MKTVGKINKNDLQCFCTAYKFVSVDENGSP